MKKILMTILLVVLAMMFMGCPSYWGPEVTFGEVSQPYLEIYGQPDTEKDIGPYRYWTWDLGNIMFSVSFFNFDIEGVDRWEVSSEEFWYTFEQVSQPYLDEYGTPEDIYTYDSGNYHTVSWWWWSKGLEVTFSQSPYDDVYGWTVDSVYTFPPINF